MIDAVATEAMLKPNIEAVHSFVMKGETLAKHTSEPGPWQAEMCARLATIEGICRMFFVNVMAAAPFADHAAAEACIRREIEPLLTALRAFGDDIEARKVKVLQ
jgi:hypothetical protein